MVPAVASVRVTALLQTRDSSAAASLGLRENERRDTSTGWLTAKSQ